MVNSMVTKVAELLADMFLNLCSPERHREWKFGSVRVMVEMEKPVYHVNEEAVEWYENKHNEDVACPSSLITPN